MIDSISTTTLVTETRKISPSKALEVINFRPTKVPVQASKSDELI